MPKLFLSYRRADCADVVWRMHDQLKLHFGEGAIFLDEESILPGLDFRDYIGEQLSDCDVLLAVIGEGWLKAADDKGRRRLNDPNDWVRIEIETALARDIPVIPLLVGKAVMAQAADLPGGLKELANRQAARVRGGADFRNDVEQLIQRLDRLITGGSGAKPRKWPKPGVLLAAGAFILLFGLAAWQAAKYGSHSNPNSNPQESGTPDHGAAPSVSMGDHKAETPSRRTFINNRDAWTAISLDLHGLPPAKLRDRRYLALAHLHNNEAIATPDLDSRRTALLESLRQLGSAGAFAPIDRNKTIFAFQLSDLGWTAKQWDRIVDAYPYHLKQSSSSDAVTARLSAECTETLNECDQPTLRGDWLVYHLLTRAYPDDPALARCQNHLARNPGYAGAYENQALSLAAVAADLSVAEAEHVRDAIRKNPDLRQKFSLDPLLEGGTILRKNWESAPALTSAFQELCRELGMGTPRAVH